MNEERRQIIVNEIGHWRRSKLLPDQYCDFLLNLYADPGEARPKPVPSHSVGRAFSAVQQATGKQWFLTIGIFALISFVVLYFTVFHPALQIAVAAASVTALAWFGERLRKRHEALGLGIVGAAMLLLLGAGSYLLQLHGLNGWPEPLWFIAGCALLWIVYGIASAIPLLHLCGWLAAVFIYAALLSAFTEAYAWYEAQLYWLPVSCLFGWSGWFVHRFSKAVSSVLFALCAILWFMPEVYEMIFLKEQAFIQLQLLLKIGAAGGLLFVLRKKWMVWVA